MEKENTRVTSKYKEEPVPYLEERVGSKIIGDEQIQNLVHLLDRTDIAEIEIKRTDEGLRLALRKFALPDRPVLAPEAEWVDTDRQNKQCESPGHQTTDQATESDFHHLTSSLVGIFHSWLKHNGKTLVVAGDFVKVGQVIGTIEALTLLNEIEAPVSGRIQEICVQDGQQVEYGQLLLTIDRSAGSDEGKDGNF